MINPVDNRNSYTGAYERGGKKAARIEGEAPAFLLPDDGGVIWDRSGSSKSSPKPKPQKEEKEEYRPSRAAEEKKAAEELLKEKAEGSEKQPQSAFFSKIAAFFRDLFSRLWYGDEGKAGEEKGEEKEALSAESTAKDKGGDERSRRIRDSIAKKDSEALARELTDNGKKKPARNTGLLTYYDRFGRIVKPRESEAARIMRSSDHSKGVEKRPQGNYRRYI